MTINKYVLVTRPGKAGEALTEQIQAAGGQAIHLPTVSFISLVNTPLFHAALDTLEQQDWLIFISQEAVKTSLPAIQARWPDLSYLKLAAIGKTTAQLLEQLLEKITHQNIIYPEKWNTEALLALAPFTSLSQQKIMLIKGEGGRETLQTTLESRGAIVSQLISYQRALPNINTKEYIHLIKQGKINVIIASSVESLINLKTLLGELIWPIVITISLLVMSERIKILAEHLGFQTIWVAENGDYIKTLSTLV
jgi:uroporphyrinogen-III synthase